MIQEYRSRSSTILRTIWHLPQGIQGNHMTKRCQNSLWPGQDDISTYRQIIPLLRGVVYHVLTCKTHWVVSIWPMGFVHCLSMSYGIPEMVENNCSAVKNGNYSTVLWTGLFLIWPMYRNVTTLSCMSVPNNGWMLPNVWRYFWWYFPVCLLNSLLDIRPLKIMPLLGLELFDNEHPVTEHNVLEERRF